MPAKLTKKQQQILRKGLTKVFSQIEDLKRAAAPGLTPFESLVRDITNSLQIEDVHQFIWETSAIEALQHGWQEYLIDLFKDANNLANDAKRITIRPEGLHLAVARNDKRDEVDIVLENLADSPRPH